MLRVLNGGEMLATASAPCLSKMSTMSSLDEWSTYGDMLRAAVDHDNRIVDERAATTAIQYFTDNASHVSKQFLETSRLGGLINGVRKANASTLPHVSAACKAIVRVWQSLAQPHQQLPSPRNPVTPLDRFKAAHAEPLASPNSLKVKIVRSANGSMCTSPASTSVASPRQTVVASPRQTAVASPRQKLKSTAELMASYNEQLPSTMQLSVGTTPPASKPKPPPIVHDDEDEDLPIVTIVKSTQNRGTKRKVDAPYIPPREESRTPVSVKKRSVTEAPVKVNLAPVKKTPRVPVQRDWYSTLPPLTYDTVDEKEETHTNVDSYKEDETLRSRVLISSTDGAAPILALPFLNYDTADFVEHMPITMENVMPMLSSRCWRYRRPPTTDAELKAVIRGENVYEEDSID